MDLIKILGNPFNTDKNDIKKNNIIKPSKQKLYNALELINDFKKELVSIIPPEQLWGGKLTDKRLSFILGRKSSYIRNLKQIFKKTNDFQIAKDILEDFESNLRIRYNKLSKNAIICITKYRNLNNITKFSQKNYIFNFHPNINLDYFKSINTKEKAYWLGWLYAEAWLTLDKGCVRFGVEVNKNDEILIEKFAKTTGLNLEFKEINYQDRGTTRIRFVNNKYTDNLIKHGFIIGKKKSKNIELPELKTRELYLAFLLGYFDGDGTQGQSRIHSGSRKYLRQIKRKFNIKNKISLVQIDERYENSFKGECYNLYLGAELFNEMLDNYQDSLKRKRIYLRTKGLKFKRTEIEFQGLLEKKSLSKDALRNLVWKLPLYKIAEKLECNYLLVKKMCDYWGINRPRRGYWKKISK
ncbi:MAG: LAGLIDADG family homing endonuclease [Promethearchaeota archaeon]